MNYELIMSIVPRGYAGLVTDSARNAGAGGCTVLSGRGTATNRILQILGIGETEKEVVLIVSDNPTGPKIRESIIEATKSKSHFGIIFSIDIGNFSKAACYIDTEREGIDMKTQDSGSRLITVIVNKDLAEDAMEAARKAGAKGGTILNARGTAREDDAKFFGVKLVPEKELLFILIDADKEIAVLNAIKALPCLSEKGTGIEFSLPVRDFTMLGS